MNTRITLDVLIDHIIQLGQKNINVVDKNDVFNNMVSDNTFNTLQKDSMVVNNFPKDCEKIFTPFIKDIYRHNTLVKEDSFFDCAISCIFEAYNEKGITDRTIIIKTFKDKMVADLTEKKLFHILKYKALGNTIKNIADHISSSSSNKITVRYFADYFGINIFIANITEDKLYVVYGGEVFNMHKPSIFLSFYDNIFERMSFENKFTWNNTLAYNKILTSDYNKLFTWGQGDIQVVVTREELEPYLVEPTDETKYANRIGEIMCRTG
jgi:hypothetical protein